MAQDVTAPASDGWLRVEARDTTCDWSSGGTTCLVDNGAAASAERTLSTHQLPALTTHVVRTRRVAGIGNGQVTDVRNCRKAGEGLAVRGLPGLRERKSGLGQRPGWRDPGCEADRRCEAKPDAGGGGQRVADVGEGRGVQQRRSDESGEAG